MVKSCLKKQFGSLAVIILIIIVSINSYAQLNPAVGAGKWKYVNPLQYGFTMNDMSFIDNRTGLAVGGNGAMARTTDSGRNWQYIPFKFINQSNTVALASFNDVQFVTPTIAYAVGTSGLMVKSIDGGLNWTTIATPLTPFNRNINGLHFLNKDTGYIGGAAINTTNTTSINDAPKVYFTKNGGVTWDSLATPFRAAQNNVTLSGFNTTEIQRIVFLNDSVGYICGSANASPNLSAILWKFEKGILKDYSLHRTKFGVSITTGTGSNPTQCTQTYKGLVAVNDSTVIISSNSNGIAVRVRTGKNDSTANAVPAIYGAYERGKYELILQLNTNPSIPVGSTLSPGAMWHIKKAPNGNLIMSDGNKVAFSTDGGTNWNSTQPIPSTSNIAHWGYTAIDVTPNGRIIVAGFNGILFDSLPGTPWRTQYSNFKPLFYSFGDMDWADCNNGVLVGANGAIAKTSDAGKTWVDNSNPVFDAAFISLSNVYYHAVNSMFFSTGTTIYKSADQGTTNDALFTEPNVNGQINGFAMSGQNRAWAIGYRFSPAVERTMIFRSLNANAASPVWDTVKTFPVGTLAPQLRNIKFANQDTGYTCGNRGKVYRTVNAGATWTDISPDTLVNANGTATYTGLSVINGRTLYIGGTSRKLFRSTDAGATWTDLTLAVTTNPITVGSFTSIGNIAMNDVNGGYIQAGGLLLRTTDGWLTYTYDMAPGGMQSITLYPKMSGPLDSKKLYANFLTAGFPGPISTQTATVMEYNHSSLVNVSSSEAITNATCTSLSGGAVTISAVGGIAPYTYSINGTTFQSSNVFSGLNQGTKTITIKDAACGVFTKTITIGFTDNLTLTTNNDTSVCSGAPVQMIATSAATATFAWTPAAGLSNAAISNPVATVNSNSSFTVTASLNGCTKVKTINISIKPSPVVNAGPDKTIVSGDAVVLNGSGSNAVNIAWTPNNTLVGANTYTPTAKPTTTTTYTLTVTDNNSCTSTDNTIVTVIPYCVKIMNAFSPNGDGMNDRWLVTNGASCANQVIATVYNRYGTKIYTNENYQNNWDGTYNGKPIPDGTYYYMVTFRLINGDNQIFRGDVTILR